MTRSGLHRELGAALDFVEHERIRILVDPSRPGDAEELSRLEAINEAVNAYLAGQAHRTAAAEANPALAEEK